MLYLFCADLWVLQNVRDAIITAHKGCLLPFYSLLAYTYHTVVRSGIPENSLDELQNCTYMSRNLCLADTNHVRNKLRTKRYHISGIRLHHLQSYIIHSKRYYAQYNCLFKIVFEPENVTCRYLLNTISS